MNDKLYVGVSRHNITPEIGCHLAGYSANIISDSKNDDLYVTAFAFGKGETKALMVSIELCSLKLFIVDEVRSEIAKTTGVSYESIILSCTHTHTGPRLSGGAGWGEPDMEYYNSIFKPAILKAASDAVGSMEPATMAVARGLSSVGMNRRELTLENKIKLGQNPYGVYNPHMTIVAFKNESGKPLGNMIHYGCHGTSAGSIRTISADWMGIMNRALEEKSGALTAFFNGPEGDVGPRISNGLTIGNDGMKFVYELGAVAAKDALRIFDCLGEYKDADLSAKTGTLRLPLAKRLSLEEAKKGMKEYEGKTNNTELKAYDYYKRVAQSYEEGFKEEDFREIKQTIIAIGDIVFVGNPYEHFSEIGIRIDAAVPDKTVLSLALSNGSFGYFPTQDQLCRGGYEIFMFTHSDIQRFTDDADFQFIKETLRNIDETIN